MHAVCSVYIHLHTVYVHLFRLYLFISNAIKVYETHIHSFGTFHSNRTVVVLLHKQALPVSDCWHLMFSQHLTLFLILSALSQIVHMLL